MDAQVFWRVIGAYNQHTITAQGGLLLAAALMIAASYRRKVHWSAKFALGVLHFFIGIVFFAQYGTEAIQRYFALPLYLLCGILFFCECWRNKDDVLERPRGLQALLLLLCLCYPLVSLLLGNRFPQMVTPVMPCPVSSVSMVVYTGYRRKNRLLLLLLTIWGLTGVKAILFCAYEDLILLACGLYSLRILIKESRKTETV